ncbi:MAG: hypothetical protein NT018_09550 [Armatimonadetes bacterium]|nr:hypothetical protein [Armatimonadota bacterium]
MTSRLSIFVVLMMFAAVTAANATVAVNGLFSNHTVLQRDKPCPIWGTAAPNKTITVVFNGQTKTTTSDSVGDWRLSLDAMAAKAASGNMTITESGANTITVTDVVVGDVWMCGGQSNMAYNLGVNADGAYTGIRWMWVNTGAPFVLADPWRNITSTWNTYTNIGNFSAVAYYFARKIYLDQGSTIPIGLIGNSVGGTRIDPWLIQEGCTDIPVLAPLYSQDVLTGPFCLANNLTHPVSPFAIKGLIWYQGENAENTNQSPDSYFLKEKGLYQGFKRLFGLDDFAMYVTLLASWSPPPTGPNAIPDTQTDNWADVRIQQANVLGLQHGGAASAMDVGDAVDIHPADKFDVGERLALWALKNDYGRTAILPSGPILKDVTVTGNKVTCSFDYVVSGLMVGYKAPTAGVATVPIVGGVLKRFSIAAATGNWYDATATIVGNTVELSSPSVAVPKKIAYAMWNNPTDGLDRTTLKEGLLYNVEGLPANTFYLDDVGAKFTVTASAGANGSISPVGATTYLKRKTALYSITPNSTYYIADVTVDGVSVGAVKYYTFDPLYANHTINATFASTAPNFTVTSSVAAGGSISPLGAQTITQGGSQTFNIAANSGVQIAGVAVDGEPMGKRSYFTFSDVRTNHTIAASFICTINAQCGYGGTISSAGATDVTYGSNKTYTIAANAGFSISKVIVDGVSQGVISSYTFTNVTTNHTISAAFIGSGGAGDVPQQNQIIFSSIVDSLPASGSISSWPTYIPSGQSLSPLGTPTVTTIDGRKFAHNVASEGDGFNKGSYTSPIACNGASIVVVAKPTRSGMDTNWQAIVDAFDLLALGVMTGSGEVYARRMGTSSYSSATIPDGQTTILSLVVQPDGPFKVWVNGVQVISDGGSSAMTSLTPNGTGHITVGRNWADTWSTFNGEIGDVFLYKTALSDAERVKLETYMANRLAYTGPTWTITASAGANGSINPGGTTTVNQGATQTVSMAPNAGYAVSNVIVDSVSQGAISSYTFTNMQANHTISVTFVALPAYTITASAGANGTISPSGSVQVYQTGSQAFTITANSGYVISTITVDSVVQGTLYTGVHTQTFTNVQANHTISATFKVAPTYTQTRYEAENAVLTNSANIVDDVNASGGKRVAKGNQGGTGDLVTFTVPVTQAGDYTMVLGSYFDGRATYIKVNGVSLGLPIVSSGPDSKGYCRNSVVIPMNAGSNAIVLYNDIDWGPHWDYIDIAQPVGNTFTITASAGANGSITPSGAVVVNQGSNQTFNITPNAGYAIAQVTVDGANQGAIATYTFSNVQTTHTISATFVALPTYTITASAGANGTISPTGAVSVTQGNNKTFTFTPDTGYVVDQVTIDGGAPVAAGASYTFTNVTANGHTIAITFKPAPTFTITASSDANGTISPTGAVIVTQGNNQTFTMTANSGYRVSRVLVDGVSVGAVTTYTFSNVIVAHTISAEFISTDFVAYWKFDETSGASAYDWSGNGKNGTLFNSSAWAAGLFNNAVNIPGGTSYVSVPSGIVLGLTNFSIATWVKLTTVATNMRIFDFGTSATNYMELTPKHSDTNGVLQYVIRTPGTVNTVSGAAALPTGSWQHVAITRSGITNTLYRNGVQVGQITRTLSPNSLTSTTINRIGDSQTSAHPHLDGLVDDFRIYNKALTATEITNLYNAGVAKTITASAGANGSVTPSGAVSVNYGANQIFTFSPSAGYGILSMNVDGSPIIPVTGYTFNNVIANHTISAAFAKLIGINNRTALTDAKVPGKVIKIWGKVKSVGSGAFQISDGYCVNVTIAGPTAGLDETKTVVVIGTVNADKSVTAQTIQIF